MMETLVKRCARKLRIPVIICLYLTYLHSDCFATQHELITTDTFTAPGKPTTDYVSARQYAKENHTMVYFAKLRMGCAESIITSLNSYSTQNVYAQLRIPIVGASIYGFMGPNWDDYPEFFWKVVAVGGYFTGDGPADVVYEDPNDDRQKAVAMSAYDYDSRGGTVSGNYLSSLEQKLGYELSSFTWGVHRVLYSRDDTAYNKLRTTSEGSAMESGFVKNALNMTFWKYTTRPRLLNWMKNSSNYEHGILDATGTDVSPNYLLHIAVDSTTTKMVRNGPSDSEKERVTYVNFYDNIQDWYKIYNLPTNLTYTICMKNVFDPDGDGTIYHFDNFTSASFSTNISECLNRCKKSARMVDSVNGFSFNANDDGEAYICFGLTNTEGLQLPADDKTVKDKIVRYQFTLSGSEKQPDPEPQDSTPQYNTNVFVIASLSDLVYEGGTSDPESYEVSIDRKTPATGSLSIHMVVDDIQKGLASWSDGESGVKEMSYQFPLDPEYNTDTSHDVIFKNYFMKLSHPVTVRDACVKYSATEYSYYNDDGISMYPLSGDWFVNKDDVFQCHTTDASTNATIVSLCLQPTKSGTMHITSDATDATVSVYDTYTSSNVKETNYIYYDDRNIYIKNTDSHVHKQPSGSATVIYKTTASLSFNTDSNKVIRIDAKSGTKFPTFELVR